MHGMIDFSAPLAGLDTADSTVSRVASKIATVGTPGDRVDLSVEMVSLMQAQNDFESNAKVLQTEDQMTRSTLNILA